MKKELIYKFMEGMVLFAFGCVLRNQPVLCLILCTGTVVLHQILFYPCPSEILSALLITVPFAVLLPISGLTREMPLLFVCIFANVLVNMFWKGRKSEAAVLGIDLFAAVFVLFSFLLKNFSIIAIVISVWLPVFLGKLRIEKRIVKQSKAY